MFCAHVPEMTFPDLQSGAVAEPDWGVGMQVSGRGFLTVEVLSPGFAIFCFLVLSSTMPKLSSLCNLPNPGRPPHRPTAAPPSESDQPPGFSRDGWDLARKFPGRTLDEKFSTVLSKKSDSINRSSLKG
jgi:hypothetical protein